MHYPHQALRAGIACLLLLVPIVAVRAGDKPAYTQQIDQFIKTCLDVAKIPASDAADDAEFLRRVYLDLIGRIPTYEQTTTFLASKDADKRAKLIDELLARPADGALVQQTGSR